jgi:DNA (cytosine-5)-methyltransferase 1
MSTYRILDVFSGAGGAGYGYHLAGFEVVGLDIKPQNHYPLEFHQGDALAVLDTLIAGNQWNGYTLDDFDSIHSSPECKAYTVCNLSPKQNYQMLIGEVRQRLQRIGKPYVIENVAGAKKHMQASLVLCGTMFGLPMERHRLFESNVFMFPPAMCDHSIAHIAVYGHSVWDSWLEGTPRKDGRKRPDSVSIEVGRRAMQIDWMNIEELAEAIPPAYTRFLGEQLMQAVLYNREQEIA